MKGGCRGKVNTPTIFILQSTLTQFSLYETYNISPWDLARLSYFTKHGAVMYKRYNARDVYGHMNV